MDIGVITLDETQSADTGRSQVRTQPRGLLNMADLENRVEEDVFCLGLVDYIPVLGFLWYSYRTMCVDPSNDRPFRDFFNTLFLFSYNSGLACVIYAYYS